MALQRRFAYAWMLVAATAAADPAPSNGTSDDPPASAATTEPIAPPAPDASPKKIEDAKEVAQKAKLTPIIPSPTNPTKPAFQLYAEIDPPILAVGTVFALARLTKTQQAFCAPACSASGLNGIDKLTAGYYSAGWS